MRLRLPPCAKLGCRHPYNGWAVRAPNRYFENVTNRSKWNLHARGSHEQPLSRCLPPPADRRPPGLVHAAGRPLYEAVPGHPRQARHPGNLQAPGSGRAGHAAAGGDSGRRRRHHFRRPAAAGRADGPEAALRRRRRPGDRQSGAHLERHRQPVDFEHRRSGLRRASRSSW